MTVAFFQVQLSVRPKTGGEAELVLPEVLQDLPCEFVLVKEGGEEGIVKLDAPDAKLKKIEKDKQCKKLSTTQVETIKDTYPAPKLKHKYRQQSSEDAEGRADISSSFVVDSAGNPVVGTWQTVRSGFYLIDVPISSPSD